MKMFHRMLALGLCLGFNGEIRAAEQAMPDKDKWTALTPPATEIEVKQKDGTMAKQPGSISNIAVDRKTGDLLAFVNGAGLFKSTDQGKTFKSLYETKGSCASTFSLLVDPMAGATRIFCLLHSAPSALTLDGGKTWIAVSHNNYSGMVDWNDPEAKTMMARSSGHDMWKLTQDQGKTWANLKAKDVGWGFTFGLFDSKTIVTVGSAIMRSDDAGATFTEAGKANGSGYIVRPLVAFKDHGYILVKEGMAVSMDKGKTWNVLTIPANINAGPLFGKDENHIILAGNKDGFHESKDAGKTWNKVVGMPINVHDIGGNMNHGDNGNCAYDPAHDTFYLCSRGNPVYKYQRK